MIDKLRCVLPDTISDIPNLISIYLFGSVARGTYNESSDIDLLFTFDSGLNSVLIPDRITIIQNLELTLANYFNRPVQIVGPYELRFFTGYEQDLKLLYKV